MRFEVSKVLDAIEARLTTDPALARAVVDLSEIVRYADLDGGRPASMLRLGLVIDALGRHVAEESVPVYAVAPRSLLSDADLTSNERMVVRRWADDGVVEVVPEMGDRVLEVAELIGLPVLTRSRAEQFRDRRPWVEANFKETDLTYVVPGQKAVVVLDIYPDITWDAEVETISPATGAEFAILPPQNASGNWVKVVQRLPVRLRLIERQGEPPLRAGMTAWVSIDTQRSRSLSSIFGGGTAAAAKRQ